MENEVKEATLPKKKEEEKKKERKKIYEG